MSSAADAAQALVIFVTEEQVKNENFPGLAASVPNPTFDIRSIIQDFKGKVKTHTVAYHSIASSPSSSSSSSSSTSSASYLRVIIVGLGKEKDVTIDGIRVATHVAVSAVQSLKLTRASAVLPSLQTHVLSGLASLSSSSPSSSTSSSSSSPFPSSTSPSFMPSSLSSLPLSPSLSPSDLCNLSIIGAVSRTSLLSSHRFDKYLCKDSYKPTLDSLQLLVDVAGGTTFSRTFAEAADTVVSTSQSVITGTLLSRELANDRADRVTPEYVEQIARDLCSTHSQSLTFTVLQADELKARGYTLISAVGQGAVVPPRIVTVMYKGDPSSDKCDIAVVGKGITFDSGGLNIKSTGNIEEMHLDMGGSAAVLGVMKSLSLLKPKINVVGCLALAENAIGSKAYKPHQIIMTKKGSVEINNTDAEGRLVLADAFTHVQENFAPTKMIDLATLTGACMVALGECLAGVFSNNDGMAANLVSCGNKTYERCWHMPILHEHSAELKGTYSDLRSTGKTRYGGASTAAAFLQKFVDKDVTWAHLDIAGPGMYSTARDFMPQGGTGFGVQLLVEYIMTDSSISKK